ncbi:MAG: hypothetical protein ACM3PT_04755 [Deltaproteobacteria bacterium]
MNDSEIAFPLFKEITKNGNKRSISANNGIDKMYGNSNFLLRYKKNFHKKMKMANEIIAILIGLIIEYDKSGTQ